MICSSMIEEQINKKQLISFPKNDLDITIETRLAEGIEGSVWDLTVDKILYFTKQNSSTITRTKRRLPEYYDEVLDTNGFWNLNPGYYLTQSLETVNMPLDMSGLVIPRSSVFRGGALPIGTRIAPGYSGKIVTGLNVLQQTGTFTIERGARLMSVAFDLIDLPVIKFDNPLQLAQEMAHHVGMYKGIWTGGRVSTEGKEERAF
jgi:deoxycytidine triphosphate deaminase